MRVVSVAFAAGLFVACSRPTTIVADPVPNTKDASAAPPPSASTAEPVDLLPPLPCALPEKPTDLVFSIDRFVQPIGGPSREERGEVTTHGTCTPGVECVRISEASLAHVLELFRKALAARHRKDKTSPHYGYRTLTARFSSGSCSVLDGATGPIADEDRPAFYAAFDAIVDAIVGARDGGPPP